MGDVGAVATLLGGILGVIFDADGYEQYSREKKLDYLRKGINECLTDDTMDRLDVLFAAYRELRSQTGP